MVLELRGIATLAHDTHVEKNLGSAGIKLTDGFSPPIPDDTLRIWKNQFSSCDGIPFVKLHGSINWARFDLLEPNKYETLPQSEIGVIETSNLKESVYLHSTGANRRRFLLIDTFNVFS